MSKCHTWQDDLDLYSLSCDRAVNSPKVRGHVLWCLSSVKGNIKKSQPHIWRPHPLLALVKCCFLCNLTQSDSKKKRELPILWKVSSCSCAAQCQNTGKQQLHPPNGVPRTRRTWKKRFTRWQMCVVMTPPAGLNETGLSCVVGSVLVKNCMNLTVKLFNDSKQHSKIFF